MLTAYTGGSSDMTAVPSDVNDAKLREFFLKDSMRQAIAALTEHTLPRWGNMTPQQMIEHLVWAFRCSTGILDLPCFTPTSILGRTKRFLYDNRDTPRELKNPAIGEKLPPLQFSTLAEAREALQKEVDHYFKQYQIDPDGHFVHPIFGPLGAEEWQRAHFKHCYHHLLQFGLIEDGSTANA
jgi:oxepin-CoA hydrolase / 3-oxo-5,6-dehydrosuberyl-CoA semialdehyde dehydrogenase